MFCELQTSFFPMIIYDNLIVSIFAVFVSIILHFSGVSQREAPFLSYKQVTAPEVKHGQEASVKDAVGGAQPYGKLGSSELEMRVM